MSRDEDKHIDSELLNLSKPINSMVVKCFTGTIRIASLLIASLLNRVIAAGLCVYETLHCIRLFLNVLCMLELNIVVG